MTEKIEITITMEPKDVNEMIQCGFHQEWLSGSDDVGSYALSSGCGLGTPWLRAKIGDDYYLADMRDFFGELIEKARACQGQNP